jgi:D-3-phosphoglycerate dehydrogenase
MGKQLVNFITCGFNLQNRVRTHAILVIGFDPSITIKSAWKLSADVEQALSVDELFSQSDFVSLILSLHNFSYPLPPQFLDC